MKYLILSLLLSIFIVSCSQSGNADSAYESGDYKKAIAVYEALLKKDPTDMIAFDNIVKCQSRILSEEAVEDHKAGKLDAALSKLQRAYKKDTTNSAALDLIDTFLESKRKEILNKLVPENNWSKIEQISTDIISFKKNDNFANLWLTKAIWETEGQKPTAKSTLAIYKAKKVLKNNKEILKLEKKSLLSVSKFLDTFKKHTLSISSNNYKVWRKTLHKSYIKGINEDIKMLSEREDNTVKSIKDYFGQIIGEPVKYGASKNGADIICYSLESNSKVIVHYTYPRMAKLESAEVVKKSSKYFVLRSEDSPIKKSDIK